MSSKQYRVLFYEDDEDAGELIREAKENYRDWSSNLCNIQEAVISSKHQFENKLDLINDPFFHLAIIDLQIDDDDDEGIRAIQSLRTEYADYDFPIVMFSKTTNQKSRDSAYAAGATSYIKKPVRRSRKVDCLADILGYWIELHIEKRPA